MKKMNLLFGAVLTLLFISCEGPQGPAGFDGVDGLDAPLPSVFEETVDFSYIINDNVWVSDLLTYNGVVDGDIYLVYISLSDGLYTPLPASIFDEFGEFQYVFDHDVDTVELQIIGDSDLSTLDNFATQNIPVRVAIIPADLIGEFSATDLKSIDTVMSLTGLTSEDIVHRFD